MKSIILSLCTAAAFFIGSTSLRAVGSPIDAGSIILGGDVGLIANLGTGGGSLRPPLSSSLVVAGALRASALGRRGCAACWPAARDNTILIQNVLNEPQWAKRMTPDDLRGLTPLIYNHVNPYGLFLLNMNERLLGEEEAAA